MQRVLVTGAGTPLARALADRLSQRDGIEALVLVDEDGPGPTRLGDAVTVGEDYSELRELVTEYRIDTIIHGALAPDRVGTDTLGVDAGVIASMHVAAIAADLAGPVRRVVGLSSTARCPASAGAPAAQSEEAPEPRVGTYAASLAEAEDYLYALADDRPNLCISILRLAELAGPGVTAPLTALLERRLVPRYLGFDPMVQFLHRNDALAAIEHACDRDLAGTFNVASRGAIRWGRAIEVAGRRGVWTVPPPAEPVGRALQVLGVPSLPLGLSDVLRYGRVVATDAIEATGFAPVHTAESCLAGLRRG